MRPWRRSRRSAGCGRTIDVDVNVNRHAMSTTPDRANKPRRYTIRELAQEFEVTSRTIRFYEDLGLLQPAREGRKRVYSQRDRTRLKLTLRGKRLGLSLQDILQLVTMYDGDADTAPQLQAFLGVLRAHRQTLQRQRDDIRETLDEIDQHEARCQQLLVALPPARG